MHKWDNVAACTTVRATVANPGIAKGEGRIASLNGGLGAEIPAGI